MSSHSWALSNNPIILSILSSPVEVRGQRIYSVLKAYNTIATSTFTDCQFGSSIRRSVAKTPYQQSSPLALMLLELAKSVGFVNVGYVLLHLFR